jgi:hypothetical protein
VRFQQTQRFVGDRRRLLDDEFRQFWRVIRDEFIPTAQSHVSDPSGAWSARLRVRPMQGARGVGEMTWSVAGPDGRATFEWVVIDGQPAIRWRRVGGHAIVTDP